VNTLRTYIIGLLIPSLFSLVMHVAVFHGSVQSEFSTSQHDDQSTHDHDHEESSHQDSDVCVAGLVHVNLVSSTVKLNAVWHLSEHLSLAIKEAMLQIASPVFSGRAPPIHI
jgi:hypothetical protein